MSSSPTKIHISGTSTNLEEDIEYLRAIFRAAHESDTIVVREWLEVARNQYDKYGDDQMDWQSIHEANLDALKRSDIFIIDITRNHFYTGFQVFEALRLKKPTLIVTRSEVKGHFISGIPDKKITIKIYKDIDTLDKIVKKFIKTNAIPTKDLRFNFFIDRRIYKYLRDKSYETGINKSEIVRDLLEKEIKRRS